MSGYITTDHVNALTALTEQINDAKRKLPAAEAWLARQIATRDHKDSQIPLKDGEQRYWQKRIDEAQATVDALKKLAYQ